MRSSILLFVISTLIFCSCQESRTKGDVKANPGSDTVAEEKVAPVAESSTGKFDIEVPAGWEKVVRNAEGDEIVFLMSPREGAGDDFSENVNVIHESNRGTGLDEYVDLNVKNMGSLQGYVNEGLQTKMLNGKECRVLKYKHVSGNTSLEAFTYFFMNEGQAYIVTCTAEKGKREGLEKTFDKTVESITFNK